MIQRIQSVYLFIAFLFSGVISFFVPLFTLTESSRYLMDYPVFMALFILSAIISFYSIFRYKNRQQQVVAGRFNIIINFSVFGFIGYTWYESLAMEIGKLGLGAFIPLISVILISLANRAIMKDEALVRAADRFR
jgi:hypothetical protein